MKSIKFPLIKVPAGLQVTLYLIKEELKTRKLFHALHTVGFDDCYFQPHLDSLIMNSLDIDDGTDETFAIYDDLMEKRSHKIDASNDSIMKQALKVYNELVNLKKTLQRKNK